MALALTLGALLALLALLVWLASGIRMVRAEHRLVIERFGRFRRTAGPGPVLTLRFVDQVHDVDQRQVVQDVPVDAITADDVAVGYDVAVYHACTDARRYVYDTADFPTALARLVETHLRGLSRELDLDAVIDSLDRLGEVLLRSVNEVADNWGARVTRVDIARLELPVDLAEARAARKAAEERIEAVLAEERAAIVAQAVKAEGEHQARLRRAEVRQVLLLMEAEREAEAIRLLADAERYRQQSLARARAEAIRIVSTAAPPPALGLGPARADRETDDDAEDEADGDADAEDDESTWSRRTA